MESLSPSRISTQKKPSPPIKSSPIAANPSPVEATGSDQIATPEKPIQLPRRARHRSVAFSVKEVKEIALTLQRPGKESADRSDLAGSDDHLLSTEEKLGIHSGPDSIPKSAKTPVKLPEMYEILIEFFNSMESSIRLLRLKGSMSTFPNICTSIQHLTERRFTYGHLAQLKYILPEAISIKKVLLRDETTCCIKPELQITLQIGTIGDSMKRKEGNDFSPLRRVFRERPADFSKMHSEGDDVPEETLPHPFNQAKPSLLSNMEREPTNSMHAAQLSNALTTQQLVGPSHMSRSFQRRFSQKSPILDEEKTSLTCLHKASPKDDHLVSSTPVRKKSLLVSPIPLPSLSTPRTQTKMATRAGNCYPEDLEDLNGTPAKLVSTPARLMTRTPELQTPKRNRPTTAYDPPPPKKSDKRSTRTKLFPTPKKNERTADEEGGTRRLSVGKDVISFLPEILLQSIREKERKALEEREAGFSEENRRRKLISCLHNIFDMIILIFQSRQSAIMTKQELVHKIIASHCRVVDRYAATARDALLTGKGGSVDDCRIVRLCLQEWPHAEGISIHWIPRTANWLARDARLQVKTGEVEEQLKLLQELVPDWISEKVASSGDVLYFVSFMNLYLYPNFEKILTFVCIC